MWELNHHNSDTVAMVSLIIAMISSQLLIQLCTSTKHQKLVGHLSFTAFISSFVFLPVHILPWSTSAILGLFLLLNIRRPNAKPTPLSRIQQGVAIIVTILISALYLGMEWIGFEWTISNLNGHEKIGSTNKELNAAIELTLNESRMFLRSHYQAIHSLWLAVLILTWVCITHTLTSIHSRSKVRQS